MGKGTDKLYITHSEWASSDAFSASAGSGLRQDSNGAQASFKRLPFTFCALSLQPFSTPVCTPDGLIFDRENIVRWLTKHNTNPVTGKALKDSDLISLQFAKNETGEYADPVTFKVLTDNTHILAIRHGDSANVFAYDTIERLNIKAKMWQDLVSEEEFARKDIITLQDPQNLESRDLSAFKFLKDGEDAGIQKEEASINTSAMGSSAKIMKPKEVASRARPEGISGPAAAKSSNSAVTKLATSSTPKQTISAPKPKSVPYNASHHTSGLAAASFTSTGVTPHTSGSLELLSEEEYLLRPRRVKQSGFVRLRTTLGALTIELLPEFAPKAVWNFVRLAQRGYYNGVGIHRNIRNFMMQSGDPTGTGRGGSSVWGRNFDDEFEGPLKHDRRGVLSMANKGKNTNSSQFFVTYRAAPHLDRKHTIFGRVLDNDEATGDGSMAVLKKLEDVPVDDKDRPKQEIRIEDMTVLVDPFEEFVKRRREGEAKEAQKEERSKAEGGGDDDERTTWTGKRIRRDGRVEAAGEDVGVGKYLKAAMAAKEGGNEDEIVGFVDEEFGLEEPTRKKLKKGGGGGFGNFEGW